VIDRESDRFGRQIKKAIWIRKTSNISRDGGSYQLSHVYGTVYLLTSETGSQSWWRPQMGGRNVDKVR